MSRDKHGPDPAGTEVPTEQQVRRTGRVITTFTWVLTGAVVTVSMFTAAPFIDAHSQGWGSGPVMSVAADGCFILSLQADSTLARYDADGGAWPRLFRWVTGLATVWLNIGDAALAKDTVGVAIHLIPPLLLLLVAEAGPAYRRALASLTHRTPGRAAEDKVAPLWARPVPGPAGVYPAPVPAVPEPYPAPAPAPVEPAVEVVPELLFMPLPARPAPVPAPDRTRPSDADGYVPEDDGYTGYTGPDQQEEAAAADELTPAAAARFADVLAEGNLPSVRTLRAEYGIGQPRAQRVRDALRPLVGAAAVSA
ncbi:hypothetical protein [Kitasatospora sp. NPDC088346]|uniref:hypothetical protein n=1 Tax=Kitasatospora sp. NPDC088346 TaxID=3364073 RepID=UPI003820CDB4